MNKGQILTILMAAVLTARMGTITHNGHKETWYDLPMDRVIERANAIYDIDEDVYAIREDGVKTYNGFVICAADKSIPFGTFVETSLGIGIVIDYHTTDKNTIDIATDWK